MLTKRPLRAAPVSALSAAAGLLAAWGASGCKAPPAAATGPERADALPGIFSFASPLDAYGKSEISRASGAFVFTHAQASPEADWVVGVEAVFTATDCPAREEKGSRPKVWLEVRTGNHSNLAELLHAFDPRVSEAGLAFGTLASRARTGSAQGHPRFLYNVGRRPGAPLTPSTLLELVVLADDPRVQLFSLGGKEYPVEKSKDVNVASFAFEALPAAEREQLLKVCGGS